MKKYIELIGLPLALIATVIFVLVAERAGVHTYDYGIFQKFFLGTVLFLAITFTARLIFKYTFPLLHEYIARDLNQKDQWNALTDTQKILVGLLLLSVYIIALSMLVANL